MRGLQQTTCLLLVLSMTTSCGEVAKDYRLAKRKAKEFKAFSDRLDRARDKRNQQAAASREREARMQEEHPHGAANFDDLSTPASERLELTPAERAQMRTEELEGQQELEELNRTQEQ